MDLLVTKRVAGAAVTATAVPSAPPRRTSSFFTLVVDALAVAVVTVNVAVAVVALGVPRALRL